MTDLEYVEIAVLRTRDRLKRAYIGDTAIDYTLSFLAEEIRRMINDKRKRGEK